MQKLKSKAMALLITSILVITIAGPLPDFANAWSLGQYTQTAFIAAGPNPIGLGQTLEVDMWLSIASPLASGYYMGRWANFTLNIWTPDGKQTTMGPYYSDSNAIVTIYYTPNTVGTYYFQFTWPGERVTGKDHNGAPIDAWFTATNSEKISITVQQDAVPWFPQSLPTSYWTRPISAINRNWESISGDWLMKDYNGQTKVNPYTTGPNSGHILWVQNNGILGGLAGPAGVGNVQNRVNQNNQAPIIFGGRLYNNINTPYGTQFTCTDMATGKLLWAQNGSITIGMNYFYNLDGGVYSYLWSTGSATWTMYDASTGQMILTLTGAQQSGTSQALMYSDQGDLLCYVYSPNKWLAMWNSSLAINLRSPPKTLPAVNWSTGIQWNATIPKLSATLTLNGLLSAGGANLWSPDVIIATDQTTSTPIDFLTMAAYKTSDGTMLWNQTLPTHIPGTVGFSELGPGDGRMYNGILVAFNKASLTWYAMNYYTGEKLWETPVYNLTNNVVQMDNEFGNALMYDGVLYASYESGFVRAFNLTNGQPLWVWDNEISGAAATEPYTSRAGSFTHATPTLADGKLYLETYFSHEPLPLPQNDRLYCLNATTGKELWSIAGYYGYYQQSTPIGDGRFVSINAYDNQMYCFGQGPSKLTVGAPGAGVTISTPMTITGTLTDVSPGAQLPAVTANFPNGLPCVSDESQSGFMESVYEQQQMPTNITGVPVTISVIDSNGNYRNIGTTTTNAMGTYGLTWTPDIPGNFTVIANFEGTQSYYPSSASTYFCAGELAPTASPYPIVEEPPIGIYVAAATAAIIIAIVIGFAVTILTLRKRP